MKKEKYVLQVCAYAAPYPGNFIEVLKALHNDYWKLGYSTIFVFPNNAKGLNWCKELEKSFKIYYLPLNMARINLKTYQMMRKIYKENNIIIAHSHFELYDIPVNLMAPKHVKVFWHLHDSLDLIYQKSNFFHKLLWKGQYSLFSRNVQLLSVSEKAKDYAIKLGFNSKNAIFLPNGIDTKRIHIDKKSNYENDFLMFGWDYQRKGVDLLLNSLEFLKHEEFKVALVAGNETWDQINLNNYKQLFKQDAVRDVSKLYSVSKCFLHISRSEGLSYALLEAIYAGCIVICSDIEQNLFAKDIPTVYFVANNDFKEISTMMKKVIDNQIVMKNEAIEVARKMIEQRYSIDAWKNKIKDYYFYE